MQENEAQHQFSTRRKKKKWTGWRPETDEARIEFRKAVRRQKEDQETIQKIIEEAAEKVARTTKPHRDNVVERTPEKLGAQNDKRRLLKKQARKARADNLIRCTKEKGVDGFVRQGKFTDDGQEWNQKLHRHCEGVCILIPMRRGKCSTPLHATFEHLVNTLLKLKTPLASQSPATASPPRWSTSLARPSSSTQRIMAPMTEAQRCGRSLKRWLLGDGCVLARTQAIRPKCVNLNFFLKRNTMIFRSTNTSLAIAQAVLHHNSGLLSADARGRPPLWARQPPPPQFLYHTLTNPLGHCHVTCCTQLSQRDHDDTLRLHGGS